MCWISEAWKLGGLDGEKLETCKGLVNQANPFGEKLYLCGPSRGIPGATWRGLVGSSFPLGDRCGCSLAVLKPAWSGLGAGLGALGMVLGGLGAILDGLEAVLGLFGSGLGAVLGHRGGLGGSWGALGAFLAVLGMILGDLGAGLGRS